MTASTSSAPQPPPTARLARRARLRRRRRRRRRRRFVRHGGEGAHVDDSHSFAGAHARRGARRRWLDPADDGDPTASARDGDALAVNKPEHAGRLEEQVVRPDRRRGARPAHRASARRRGEDLSHEKDRRRTVARTDERIAKVVQCGRSQRRRRADQRVVERPMQLEQRRGASALLFGHLLDAPHDHTDEARHAPEVADAGALAAATPLLAQGEDRSPRADRRDDVADLPPDRDLPGAIAGVAHHRRGECPDRQPGRDDPLGGGSLRGRALPCEAPIRIDGACIRRRRGRCARLRWIGARCKRPAVQAHRAPCARLRRIDWRCGRARGTPRRAVDGRCAPQVRRSDPRWLAASAVDGRGSAAGEARRARERDGGCGQVHRNRTPRDHRRPSRDR